MGNHRPPEAVQDPEADTLPEPEIELRRRARDRDAEARAPEPVKLMEGRTDPARTGTATSEWKATLATGAAGLLAAGVALFADGVPADELREVLLWLAGLLVGGSGTAYTIARTSLKRGLMDAGDGAR